jgi:hypothetical protein
VFICVFNALLAAVPEASGSAITARLVTQNTDFLCGQRITGKLTNNGPVTTNRMVMACLPSVYSQSKLMPLTAGQNRGRHRLRLIPMAPFRRVAAAF